jgi:hypothetical protein
MRLEIWALLGLFVASAPASCRRSPMSRIEALRDALAVGSRENALGAVDVPACPDLRTEASLGACLETTARAFGATAFSAQHPDQASAAAVAFLLFRDHRGALVPKPDTWLEAVAKASGAGADALRLALATSMAEEAPKVGKPIEDEPAARVLAGAVARAIPGACSTYADLGAGKEIASLLAQDSPDHSPCVQHDLERRDGPGPAYGDGTWRAAAGAAALWRDGAHALTIGFGTTEGSTRRAIQRKLAVIDIATRDLTVRVVSTTQAAGYNVGETHVPHAGTSAGAAPRDGGGGSASP